MADARRYARFIAAANPPTAAPARQAQLRDRLGIAPGQEFEFSNEDGRLIARKVRTRNPVDAVYGILVLIDIFGGDPRYGPLSRVAREDCSAEGALVVSGTVLGRDGGRLPERGRRRGCGGVHPRLSMRFETASLQATKS